MITVVRMTAAHVPGVVALQSACFPPPFPQDQLWTEPHIRRHLEVFPEGQLVVLADDLVVGSASNCLVGEAVWHAHLPWSETVSGPFIENHDPDGSTLYGLDISVHPNYRGRSAMRMLYQARFDLVRERRLARYGTAVRMPGFASYALANADTTAEKYVEAVVRGDVVDRTLTPMLKVGLRPDGVIENYMLDPESGNAAAVLQWP